MRHNTVCSYGEAAFAGLTLALNTRWGFVVLAPILLFVHLRVVLREERYLEQKFGGDYRRYRTIVPTQHGADLNQSGAPVSKRSSIMAPRFIARQLANPSGMFGRLIGVLMNRHNARMNAFAVRELQLTSSDRVLEIGFGGGVALPALIAQARSVAGVDRSNEMVACARRRFARAVTAGRADFRQGDVDALPFGPGSFSKAQTVNTIYFWDSLDAGFAEIRRVLAPQGRLAIGFLPKERMQRMRLPPDVFTLRAPEDVIAALRRVGFESPSVKRPDARTPWHVVVATS